MLIGPIIQMSEDVYAIKYKGISIEFSVHTEEKDDYNTPHFNQVTVINTLYVPV